MNATIPQILWALLGTLLYLLLLLPFFLIWIPYRILLSSEQIYIFDIGVFRYLGLVPIALGVIIYVFCSLSFVFIGKGTPVPFTPTKELIVTGLYRFVRNPLYIAGVFVLAGEALLFQSIGIFFYCLVLFGGFNLHVLMEETLLADKFGTSYERYRNSVPRWIPRLKPYRNNNTESQ
jgi:protein-S-isoprenylcysteine O-methyltransferase Ste14